MFIKRLQGQMHPIKNSFSILLNFKKGGQTSLQFPTVLLQHFNVAKYANNDMDTL